MARPRIIGTVPQTRKLMSRYRVGLTVAGARLLEFHPTPDAVWELARFSVECACGHRRCVTRVCLRSAERSGNELGCEEPGCPNNAHGRRLVSKVPAGRAKAAAATRARKAERKAEGKKRKWCLRCGNLPWRVMPREPGARCEDCGLAYQPEESLNG